MRYLALIIWMLLTAILCVSFFGMLILDITEQVEKWFALRLLIMGKKL